MPQTAGGRVKVLEKKSRELFEEKGQPRGGGVNLGVEEAKTVKGRRGGIRGLGGRNDRETKKPKTGIQQERKLGNNKKKKITGWSAVHLASGPQYENQ